jgi:hypothetical protein
MKSELRLSDHYPVNGISLTSIASPEARTEIPISIFVAVSTIALAARSPTRFQSVAAASGGKDDINSKLCAVTIESAVHLCLPSIYNCSAKRHDAWFCEVFQALRTICNLQDCYLL